MWASALKDTHPHADIQLEADARMWEEMPGIHLVKS